MPPLQRLALCFRDRPVDLDEIPAQPLLSDRVELKCREMGIVCMVDILHLRPERSLRSLVRPMPRTQNVVTTMWPNEDVLHEALASSTLLEEIRQTSHVAFWAPGSFIPGLSEVAKRLARQETLGGSGLLGRLGSVPKPLAEPPEYMEHPAEDEMTIHETRLREDPCLSALQYDCRVFSSLSNTDNGDVQPGLSFRYFESDGIVWAFYEGQGISLGTFIARKDPHGRLRMRYQHISNTDELHEGVCFSYPEILNDGYLRMHEFWRWTSVDGSAGQSVLEEVLSVTGDRKIP